MIFKFSFESADMMEFSTSICHAIYISGMIVIFICSIMVMYVFMQDEEIMYCSWILLWIVDIFFSQRGDVVLI